MTSIADILLHGTLLEQLERKLEGLGEDGVLDECGSGCCGEEDLEPLSPDDGTINVHGQRFYPDIEAQELGAAWYLLRCKPCVQMV